MENIRIVPLGLKDWAVIQDSKVVGIYKTKPEAQRAALRLAMGKVGER